MSHSPTDAPPQFDRVKVIDLRNLCREVDSTRRSLFLQLAIFSLPVLAVLSQGVAYLRDTLLSGTPNPALTAAQAIAGMAGTLVVSLPFLLTLGSLVGNARLALTSLWFWRVAPALVALLLVVLTELQRRTTQTTGYEAAIYVTVMLILGGFLTYLIIRNQKRLLHAINWRNPNCGPDSVNAFSNALTFRMPRVHALRIFTYLFWRLFALAKVTASYAISMLGFILVFYAALPQMFLPLAALVALVSPIVLTGILPGALIMRLGYPNLGLATLCILPFITCFAVLYWASKNRSRIERGVEIVHWFFMLPMYIPVLFVRLGEFLRGKFWNLREKANNAIATPALKNATDNKVESVLYLRSFTDDAQYLSTGSWFSEADRFEHALLKPLWIYGDVLKIATADSIHKSGARYLIVDNTSRPQDIHATINATPDNSIAITEAWHKVILAKMHSAQLIVLVIGATSGLIWELKALEQHGHIRKTIFVRPVNSSFSPQNFRFPPNFNFLDIMLTDQGCTACIANHNRITYFHCGNVANEKTRYQVALRLASASIISQNTLSTRTS